MGEKERTYKGELLMFNTEPMLDLEDIVNFIIRIDQIKHDSITKSNLISAIVFLQAACLIEFEKPLITTEILQGNTGPFIPLVNQHFKSPIIKKEHQLIAKATVEKDPDGKIIQGSIKINPPSNVIPLTKDENRFIIMSLSNLLEHRKLLKDILMNQPIYIKPGKNKPQAYDSIKLYNYFITHTNNMLWL